MQQLVADAVGYPGVRSPTGDRFSSIMGEGGWAITCTAEVVGEEHREQIDLITGPGRGGYIIELIVAFELGEDPLLTVPSTLRHKPASF